MPMPIMLAHKILMHAAKLRKEGKIKWLRPDSKSQVTLEYDGHNPVRIDTVVVSHQHDEDVSYDEIKKTIIDKIVKPVIGTDRAVGRQSQISHQSDRSVCDRRSSRRFRSDGSKDHCGHLRWYGSSWRRRVQR